MSIGGGSIKVKEFISKLKEIGFDDETEIEFELTDYENSFFYPELGVHGIDAIERDIYDVKEPNILVSLEY